MPPSRSLRTQRIASRTPPLQVLVEFAILRARRLREDHTAVPKYVGLILIVNLLYDLYFIKWICWTVCWLYWNARYGGTQPSLAVRVPTTVMLVVDKGFAVSGRSHWYRRVKSCCTGHQDAYHVTVFQLVWTLTVMICQFPLCSRTDASLPKWMNKLEDTRILLTETDFSPLLLVTNFI